MLTKLEKQKMI